MDKPNVSYNHDGGITISAIIDDCYIHRLYYGYSTREAIKLFAVDVNHSK